jgi:microcystin-dependent protein
MGYAYPDPVPIGGILMWSGPLASIPVNYAICDGTPPTPDLRDLFPVGAGGSYPVGDQAGENEHTLTVDEIPAHHHSTTYATGAGGVLTLVSPTASVANKVRITADTGNNGPHENRPPYYALYFIMKVT